jgi:drug/metabolite transporter (DMT)-like permease
MDNVKKGHIIAFATIFMWSTTFVSTKVVLESLSPIEILLFRFCLGYFALLIVHPRFKLFTSIKDEILFLLLGGSGVFLYFILENIALQYTQATNVGVIVSTAPIFTALIASILVKDAKINIGLIFGFFLAISGILLLISDRSEVLELNLVGDMIALAGSFSFGLYSVLTQKVDSNKYHYIFVTQKTFVYGIIWMLIYILVSGEKLTYSNIFDVRILSNMLFLGLVASGLCFVLWNYAIRLIGSVSTSNYIYLVPLITAVTAVVVLGERVTWSILGGGILIILGLLISQGKIGIIRISQRI